MYPSALPAPGEGWGLCALGIDRGCAGLDFGDGLFAHRLAREREAVVVLHQPVQHRVSNRRVPNPLVPVLYGQLTGDDGGFRVGPVVDVSAPIEY